MPRDRPALILLDEPLAGLSTHAVDVMTEMIRCARARRNRETRRVVLAGSHETLLSDPRVQRAYLGA